MNTKLLMAASALVMGATGIALSFLPQEIAAYIGLSETNALVLQLMGAMYFGFAMLNWTAKANLIGGIYSRPVALGNFTHFMIGALTLLKFIFNNSSEIALLAVGLAYLVFAALFGYVFFTHPVKVEG